MRFVSQVLSFFLVQVFALSLSYAAPETDPHSFSNPAEVSVRHIKWSLQFDFEAEWLSAEVEEFLNPSSAADLILDSRGLRIESVEICLESGSCRPTNFELGPEDPNLGQSLKIAIEPNRTKSAKIRYQAKRESPGFGFIPAEQTESKKFPTAYFLASSHNLRTLIPIQDTPSQRFTFEADIRLPQPGPLVLMTAPNLVRSSGTNLYRFKMDTPIPSYLFGFVMGDFAFISITDRIGIYSEPSRLREAKQKLTPLAQVADWFHAWLGPIPWERHDMVFMPRTFPIGGMEVPLINYLSSRILTGLEPDIAIVIHEYAHGYNGGRLNAANLNHFWINEGLTVYLERRGLEHLLGKDRSDLEEVEGWLTLQATMKKNLAEAKPFENALWRDLNGRHPIDKLSDVPYEKGFLLFKYLEKLVGRSRLDPFINAYLKASTGTAIRSDDFIQLVEKDLLTPEETRRVKLSDWIYDPGLHSEVEAPRSRLYDTLLKEIQRFVTGDRAALLRWKDLSMKENIVLLADLRTRNLSAQDLRDIRAFVNFGLSEWPTPVQIYWLEMTAGAGMVETFPEILDFVLNRPAGAYSLNRLFGALEKTAGGRSYFQEHSSKILPTLHPHSRVRCSGVIARLTSASSSQ